MNRRLNFWILSLSTKHKNKALPVQGQIAMAPNPEIVQIKYCSVDVYERINCESRSGASIVKSVLQYSDVGASTLWCFIIFPPNTNITEALPAQGRKDLAPNTNFGNRF